MKEMTWQQQAIELSKFVKQDGTKLSWRNIAKALGVPKTTVQECLRKHYDMLNTVDEKDFSRILCISDLHMPFHHPKAFQFLAALKEKYKPTFVVCMGDEADKAGLSYHEKSTSLPSAADELHLTRMYMKEVEKLFPNLTLLHSNHGSLAFRRAATHGIPEAYLKSYNDVYGVGSGWKWVDHLCVTLPNGLPLYLTHGRSNDAAKVGKTQGMCIVQGHHHSLSKVEWWKPFSVQGKNQKPLWAMQLGCLIDDYSAAFSYNKGQMTAPMINCGVIIDSKPEIIFLDELVK